MTKEVSLTDELPQGSTNAIILALVNPQVKYDEMDLKELGVR